MAARETWFDTSVCAAKTPSRPCLRWVKLGSTAFARSGPPSPRNRTFRQCRYPSFDTGLMLPTHPSSVKVAAGPRNQRYWRPVSLRDGLLLARRNRQDPRQIAREFDLKPIVLRHEADLLDERADRPSGFTAQLRPIELLLQVGDLGPIDLGEPRVQGSI